MAGLNIEIISPTGILFKGICHMAIIPALDGEVGVMSDHELIITTLKAGQLVVLDEKQNQLASFDVNSGLAKMRYSENFLVLID